MHISNRQPTASPFSQRVKKLKRVNVGAATPIRYLKCIYYIPSHHIAWHHIDAAVEAMNDERLMEVRTRKCGEESQDFGDSETLAMYLSKW